MWKTAWLALAQPIVGACATNGAVTDSGCAWARPIWLAKADNLTEPTETAILEHNETWERVCRPR